MNLRSYLTTNKNGRDLTIFDIDETLFRTFAKVNVLKDGKVVKSLSSQEFDRYTVNEGETLDFKEFRSAQFFKDTSIPIPKTVERVKRMLENTKSKNSKIIFCTARSDFDDKDTFLQTFRDNGIPIDEMRVERAGNLATGTTAERKKQVILKYLNTAEYRRVRLIDDNISTLKLFLEMEKTLPSGIIKRIRKRHGLNDNEKAIEFFALLTERDGSLRRIE